MEQKYLKGAAILTAASVFVKIVSAIFRIPINNVLDAAGRGTFQVTYVVFSFLLAVSTAGVPVALSRLVSTANADGNKGLAKRYFSVALLAFLIIGLTAMLVTFFFADDFARFMNASAAATGIRVLSPAVFFACIISVYRGYAQGHENMIPTAISQVIEVICKTGIGITAAIVLARLGYDTSIVSAGAIMGVTIGLGISVIILILYKKKMDRKSDSVLVAPDISHGTLGIFGKIMKVSGPITLSAVFMSVMVLIDTSIVLGRLQTALGFSEYEASVLFGIYALGLPVYNLPLALVVPISVSIIPAIAAAIAKGRDHDSALIMQSSLKLVNLIAMPSAAGIIILAAPILKVLYNYDMQLATTITMILGAASFFACLQYITTAILQSNGHERVVLITFPIGAASKIIVAFFLSGNPHFGILASPIGTLVCFIVIAILNIAFIKARIKNKPKFVKVFIRPLLCSAVMGVATRLVYELMHRLGSTIIGSCQLAVALYLAISVIVGVIVYAVLIIATRTVTITDMKLVPKGEKLVKILRIRS